MPFLIWLLRLVLSVTFVVAGWAKLTDRKRFEKTLAQFGAAAGIRALVSWAIPLLEVGIGILLILPRSGVLGPAASTALFVLFSGAIAFNLMKGRTPECNCFGGLYSTQIGLATLVRNLVLGLVSAVMIWLIRSGADALPDWFTVASWRYFVGVWMAVSGLAFALLAWWGFQLFRQNGRLMLRIEALEHERAPVGAVSQPGVEGSLPKMQVGSIAPEFALPGMDDLVHSSGEILAGEAPKLLVFLGATCPSCNAILPEIEKWKAKSLGSSRIVVLVSGAKPGKRQAYRALGDVLFQERREIAQAYGCSADPCAILIDHQGRIASPPALGIDSVRAFVSEYVVPDAESQRAEATLRPGIGDRVPEEAFPSLGGGTLSLPQLRGKRVMVIFWNSACTYCAAIVHRLAAWEDTAVNADFRLILISASLPEHDKDLTLRSPVLQDPERRLFRALGAQGTPSALLVDEEGQIASVTIAGGEPVLALLNAASGVPTLNGVR